MCSTTGQWANYYWVTAAEISFNGGPWYYWYYSQPNWWSIPPARSGMNRGRRSKRIGGPSIETAPIITVCACYFGP
jgi:hypothetical protein